MPAPGLGRGGPGGHFLTDEEKANKRYEELRNGGDYYLDVQMDTYEVDD